MITLGLTASLLSTITVGSGLGLQMRKILRLKKADQLSIGWLVLGIITWGGWFAYGLSIHDKYIFLANGFGLVMQAGLFVLVWKYRKSR